MESKPKNELIRIAGYEGVLTIDKTGKAKGRGVYLCANQKCFTLAKKKNALKRGFNMEIGDDQINKIFEELKAYEN